MKTRELAIAAGGAITGVVALRLWQMHKAAPALPASPTAPPLAQGVSSLTGAVTITLAPGIATLSQALDVNTAVIVYLPQGGAKWVSMDGAPIGDLTSPQVFVFNGGPVSHTFVWTDGAGATQTSTLYLSVTPPAGVVST